MTPVEFETFQKEFEKLARRVNLDAYTLVVAITDKEAEDVYAAMIARVREHPSNMSMTLEQARALLMGLGQAMVQVSRQLYGLGREATLGMVQGMLSDVVDAEPFDDEDAEGEEFFLPLARRSKKDDDGWN